MTLRSNLLRRNKALAVIFLISSVIPVIAQETTHIIAVPPRLAPGEKITGKEHPENFSRRIAFQTMLELLSVQPEDALHLQRRARLLEAKRIGLNASDSAILEQIVETYRVDERGARLRADAIHRRSPLSTEFAELTRLHHVRLKAASGSINLRLSRDGKAALNRFLDEIIAHSEMQAPIAKQPK